MARHWVKLYIAAGRHLAETLPDYEWCALTKLCLWTRYRDNTIRGPGGHPARQQEIARIIRKSLRQTKAILTSLERRGVIVSYREGKSKYYAISDAITYRGTGRGMGSYIEKESPKLPKAPETQ